MPFIPSDEWKPIDVELEPTAEDALRSNQHRVIVAGPGAGKTELLAQRACYLLQTGICRPPKRILAISFKKDAARTLSDRVDKRCGKTLSHRFESYTFDAFAKSLVDRFRLAIPAAFQPTADYKLAGISLGDLGQFLNTLDPPNDVGTREAMVALPRDTFLRRFFHRFPLGQEEHEERAGGWAASELWRHLIHQRPSQLTFPMLGRLAELLLRTNPFILRALRQTYAYVFLDEFQDTTRVQFDLTRTAFLGSSAILTAVGDNRQRIMGWAEALQDAFDSFLKTYGGERRSLSMNYRSAPRLVAIQQELMRAIDRSSVPQKAYDDGSTGEGICRVCLFPDPRQEARWIADVIAGLRDDGLKPRDTCILVKQRVDLYSSTVMQALGRRDIAARVENEIQDLLAEPLSEITLLLIRYVTGENELWTEATDCLARLRYGWSDEDVMPDIERELRSFQQSIQPLRRKKHTLEQQLTDILASTLAFVDPSALKAQYPQYAQGDFFDTTVEKLRDHLAKSCVGAPTTRHALDRCLGEDCVPIMTIHKSKGLEYHTVIFLGLEDNAFWSFANQSQEDLCAFFVAFSRAKKQVFFTFSQSRVTREGRGESFQSRDTIGLLYELLAKAGVPAEQVVP
jgi:DNA helicase II / ATP-dependent DNA helicase PcrA